MRVIAPLLLLLAGCDLLGIDALGKDSGAASSDCPAAGIDHTALDWVDVEVGSREEASLVLTNECGDGPDLEVTGALTGAAFRLVDETVTLAPGESAEWVVAYEPDDGTADAGTLRLTTNDPNRPDISVTLSGIPIDDEDDDGYYPSEDCDDTDPSVHPGATDVPYDGVDSDCDGWSDYDQDRDGFDSAGFGGDDCDDTDPTVYPGAHDVPYDGVDSDCGYDSDDDADGDGQDAALFGGEDCDDTVATTYAGAPDAWYDGVDADCAGNDD
jgi:hypothetical protein